MSDALTHDRIQAEITKLLSEAGKLNAETAKLHAEGSKLNAESRKLGRELFWYPVAISSALIGAVSGITLVLVRFAGH